MLRLRNSRNIQRWKPIPSVIFEHLNQVAGDVDINEAILEAAIAISQATSMLVNAAAAAQRDRVTKGRSQATTLHPYVTNSTWVLDSK